MCVGMDVRVCVLYGCQSVCECWYGCQSVCVGMDVRVCVSVGMDVRVCVLVWMSECVCWYGCQRCVLVWMSECVISERNSTVISKHCVLQRSASNGENMVLRRAVTITALSLHTAVMRCQPRC